MRRIQRVRLAALVLLAGAASASTTALAEQRTAPVQPNKAQMIDNCMRMMETTGAPNESDKGAPDRHH